MKKLLRLLLLATAALVGGASSATAQVFELQCPTGFHPFPNHTMFDNSTGQYRNWLCYDDNGNVQLSAVVSGLSTAFSGITSGVNTQAVMQAGTGASLSPLNTGQVADSQAWLQPGLIPTSVTYTSNTGGTLTPTGTVIQYTLVSVAGETLPSVAVLNTVSGPCVTSNCQATVVAPTIPPGYTGYTVYSCQANTLTGCTPHKQAASANCVNIAINCVISTIGAGAVVPTINTAIIQPPNIQAATLVPAGAIPSLFFPAVDGTYRPLAGVDFSASGVLPTPDGTFEFWHRVFINDSGANLAGAAQTNGGCIKNTLFSVCHQSGNTTSTGSAVDDRVFSYRGTDSLTSPSYGQWLGVYGEHFIYNNNFSCAPIGAGMVQEDCFAAMRVRANDQRSAGVNNVTIIGIHGTGSTNVTTPKLGSCNPCVAGVVGTASQETVNNQAPPAGAFYAGLVGSTLASAGNTNGIGVALYLKPSLTRFAGGNYDIYGDNTLSNANDFVFRFDSTAKSFMRGALDLDSLNPLNNGTILSGGSISAKAFTTTQLNPNAGNPSVVVIGVGGGTTYTYKLVYKDSNGATTQASSGFNTVTGNATLDGSNFNRIQVNTAANPLMSAGCPSTVDIYRTASAGTPSSTGKIGTFTVTDCAAFTGQLFDDTGLAGDSATPPTINITGTGFFAGDIGFNLGKGQHFDTQAANNDHAGTCTAAAATTCVVTFTRAYTSAPVCSATDATNITTVKVTPATGTLTITTTAASSDVFDYICAGNPN